MKTTFQAAVEAFRTASEDGLKEADGLIQRNYSLFSESEKAALEHERNDAVRRLNYPLRFLEREWL